MHAIQYESYGPPSQLRQVEVPDPTAGPGQLLVSVRAYGVNPLDWKIYDGSLRLVMPAHFPGIPGFDLAGTIAAVGTGVTGWKVDERVYARSDASRGNAAAELAVVSASVADRIPEALSFEEAAALPLAAMTAVQAFTEAASVSRGDAVLVTAAAGGVGHIAIQVAKALGAEVTAHTKPDAVELVRGLGASDVIVGPEIPRGRFDVILECGATVPYSALGRGLRPGGTLVSLAMSAGRVASKLYAPILGRRVRLLVSRADGELLRTVSALVASGALRPRIERTVPFDGVGEAHERLRHGHARGKTVVRVGADARPGA